MKHATSYILLAALVVIPMTNAAIYRAVAGITPTETTNIVIEATGIESRFDIGYDRKNLTHWSIEITMSGEMRKDLTKCWNDINFGNVGDCNLTMIREKYVPEDYVVTNTTLRTILSFLDALPVNSIGGNTANTTTFNVLNDSKISIDYRDKDSRTTIGLGTITTYIPTTVTQMAYEGSFNPEVTFGSPSFSEISTACYTNSSANDTAYCSANDGTASVDAAFVVNFTYPRASSYDWFVFHANVKADTTTTCTVFFYNYTRGAYHRYNSSGGGTCTQNTTLNVTNNLTQGMVENLQGSSVTRRVTFGAMTNSTGNDDLRVDIVEMIVSYTEYSITEGIVANWSNDPYQSNDNTQNDTSGYANHLTTSYTGAAYTIYNTTWNTTQFHNSSIKSSYETTRAPMSSTLQSGNVTQALTISFWWLFNSSQNEVESFPTIFGVTNTTGGSSGGNRTMLLMIDKTWPGLVFEYENGSGTSATGGFTTAWSNATWNTNSLHHIAIVIEGCGNYIQYYRDGVLNRTSAITAFPPCTFAYGKPTNSSWYWGNQEYRTSQSFRKMLVYNRSLTASEISTIYGWGNFTGTNTTGGGGSGCGYEDCTVNCATNNTISTATDYGGYNLIFSGSGTVDVTAALTNIANVQAISSCAVRTSGAGRITT